jgi:hypothetical protein
MRKSVAIAALLAVGSQTFAFNILVNAGFEDGVLDPWKQTRDFGGPEDWNATTADSFTGRWSATDRGNKFIEQRCAAVAGTDVIKVSFALKNLDATINAYTFLYSDNTEGEFLISHTNANWNVYDVTSNLDRSKSLVGVGVYGVSGGTTERTYLDDVLVDVVPEPATILAMGAGLAALASRRRK